MFLPPIDLLLPQALPPPGARRSFEARALGGRCRDWLEAAGEPGRAARLAHVLRVHNPSATALPASLANPAEATHDAYFRVARVSHADAPLALAASFATAALILLTECEEGHTRLEAPRLQGLLETLMAGAIGCVAPVTAPPCFAEAAAQPVIAMRRWLRGHQVFAVLTQGLIDALERLSAAVWAAVAAPGTSAPATQISAELASADLARANSRVVALLDAACTALEFTGDFAPGDYQAVIRPSMMPPHLPASFSGLLSADHRVFIAKLRGMVPELEALRLAQPAAHQAIQAALGRVYDSHRFVCEQFVGGAASLRHEGEAAPAGGEQIARYKEARLRVFSPPCQPARAASGPGTDLSAPRPVRSPV